MRAVKIKNDFPYYECWFARIIVEAMPVTFIIGRAGSGKTLYCHNSIVQAMRASPLGPPIYWLLPRQGTFIAERQLACGSGLAGFCRARVISFDQFAQDILNDCGGTAVPEVTGIGRRMILGHLLRQLAPNLVYFSSVARQVGLAAELDDTFAEFERAGKTADDLSKLLKELEKGDSTDFESVSLLAKLRDLHLIYDQYTRFLGDDRLDQHRRLTQVLGCIQRCTFLKGATIFVDGFTDFTDFQRRLLVAAGAAGAAVNVTLLMNPNSAVLQTPRALPMDTGLFGRTESTYRKLWLAFTQASVNVNTPLLLESTTRFAAPELADFERAFNGPRLSTSDTKPQADGSAIHRIVAPDRQSEADAVACEIRDLLSLGYRLRDIAVLVRNLSSYDTLIGASFDEHEIPYFVDKRRPAIHHPLPQFLRAALQISRSNWPDDAVMAVLKSGLAGVTSNEADELENYVLVHRVHGEGWESAQPWDFRRTLTRGGDETESLASGAPQPPRIDALRRRVTDRLLPFVHALHEDRPMPVRELVTEVFSLLDRFEVRQTLATWMTEATAGPTTGAVSAIEQRDEHGQVWSSLVELFDQLVDLLGDEPVTPAEFVEILESGLEQFDLALTPPTVDQVLVGQVDRTICPPVRATFVLGLNSGEFPAGAQDHTVLSDRDRRLLGRWRMELDPESRRRVLDEPLLGYLAFTRASERLFVTRPASDERGRKTSPSAFWLRLDELFPGLQTRTLLPRRADDVKQVSTPRQLVTSLMRWVRAGGEGADRPSSTDSPWPILYQWFATRPPHGDAIDLLRRRAWPALSYTNNAGLSPETVASLFSNPLPTTAAQLEAFAACPFQHFARYGLRLEARPDQEVNGGDLSRVYRGAMEKLVNQTISDEESDPGDPLPITEEMIASAVRNVGRTLRGEMMLASARNRYLLHRIEQTLRQVIASQRQWMKHYRFRPIRTGAGFGGQSTVPALTVDTPNGAKATVRGRIDRVDALPGTGDVVALDYRLGVGALSLPEVYYGLSLRLLTELLALAAADEVLTGQSANPVGGFSVPLLRKLQDVKHPDEALDPSGPEFLLRNKPRGLFDARSIGDLDSDGGIGPSPVISAYIKKDGNLGRRGTTDAAEHLEFSALLARVREQIGVIADGILAGNINITPYRLNRKSPCANCEYKGVCRFETTVNRYYMLGGMGRKQVLDKVTEAFHGA